MLGGNGSDLVDVVAYLLKAVRCARIQIAYVVAKDHLAAR